MSRELEEVLDGEVMEEEEKIPPVPHQQFYTPTKDSTIINFVKRDGVVMVRTVAHLSGIPAKALRAWIKHGEEYPEGPMGSFARRFNRHLATQEMRRVKDMEDIARDKGNWLPFIRTLECMNPDWARPGDKQQPQVNVQVNNNVQKIAGAGKKQSALPTGD